MTRIGVFWAAAGCSGVDRFQRFEKM